MPYRRLVLGAALALAGCQDFGGPIEGGRAPLSPQEQRLQALETRLGEVTRKVENLNVATQAQSLSRLEGEMRALRGEVERLRYDIETSERRNKELYQDLDRRLAKIENEGRSARLSIEPKMAHAPPAPASAEEESAYLASFDVLKAGRYDDAINAFKDLLSRWPEGRYAGNAWYWIGESYYVKRDYDAALQAFATLTEKFPDSPKVPDGLLKTGLAQYEKKKKDDARATWQKLVADYPNTNAAGLARKHLEQLK